MDATFGGKSHEARGVEGRGGEFECFVAPTSEPAENLLFSSNFTNPMKTPQIMKSFTLWRLDSLKEAVFSRSPCYFMKFPSPEKDFVGGDENAVSRVLKDLSKDFGRIFGYERQTHAIASQPSIPAKGSDPSSCLPLNIESPQFCGRIHRLH